MLRLSNANKARYKPILKCNGIDDWDDDETNPTPMYVGAITADEVVYAGGKYNVSNQNYYLVNEVFDDSESGAITSLGFWTLSPFGFELSTDKVFQVYYDGILQEHDVDGSYYSAFRPSIILKKMCK